MSRPSSSLDVAPAPLNVTGSPSMRSTSPAPAAPASDQGLLAPAAGSSSKMSASNSASGASSAAMSARPSATSSSTTTATMTQLKDDLDLSKLDISSPHELTAFVDDMLSRLENTFESMSDQVLDRLDGISKRIDGLETSIADLMQGNTLEELQAPSQQASSSVLRSSGDSKA